MGTQAPLAARFGRHTPAPQGLPRFLPAASRGQGAPMCRCDMFRDEHPDGWAADGVVCELALPGAQISPHLANELSQMWADAIAMAHAAPRLTESQVATLQRLASD